MTYRERREARADRLREWADKRRAKADGIEKADAELRKDLAFVAAQPGIGRATIFRRTNARQEREWAHRRKAVQMAGRAIGIDQQLERAIYSDDTDAIDRLAEKLAGLEAERERVKTFNAAVRKVKGDTAAIAAALDNLPENERRDFIAFCKLTPYHKPLERGFPAYHLTNLGGNIKRTRDRLEDLKKQAAPDAPRRFRGLLVRYGGNCAGCDAPIERGAWALYEKAEQALFCNADCTRKDG